jgi:hypothetical protein
MAEQRRPTIDERLSREAYYLGQIARIMDRAVRVPGTPWRVGLDGFLGLIPGIGDTLGAAISSIIIVQSAASGISVWVLARMVLNVAIEWAVGVIPVVGDLFDFGWKANVRNFALYSRSLRDPRSTRRRSALYTVGMSVVIIVILAALFLLFLFALRWVWRFVTG